RRRLVEIAAEDANELREAGHELRLSGARAPSRDAHGTRRTRADTLDWRRAGVDLFDVHSRGEVFGHGDVLSDDGDGMELMERGRERDEHRSRCAGTVIERIEWFRDTRWREARRQREHSALVGDDALEIRAHDFDILDRHARGVDDDAAQHRHVRWERIRWR